MKPIPQHNFPITVVRRSSQVEPAVEMLFANIFDVILNFRVTVVFIPAFRERFETLPTDLPDNIDEPADEIEARRIAAVMAKYSVTSDNHRQGNHEMIPPFDPLLEAGTLFYVSHDELEAAIKELNELADELMGIQNGRVVSSLAHLTTIKSIYKVIESEAFDKHDLAILGR